MPRAKLGELYSHFVARTNLLVSKFDTPLPPDPVHRDMCQAIHGDGRALMIIRLQLLWGEFCRELVVRSARGGCWTITGTLLNRGSATANEGAFHHAVYKDRGGRPPTWHIPDFAVTVARRLGTHNFDQIHLALSQVSPVNDLRYVRNYIVHPQEATRTEYLRVAWRLNSPGVDAVSLLSFRDVGGATRFEEWVADLQMMALDAVR